MLHIWDCPNNCNELEDVVGEKGGVMMLCIGVDAKEGGIPGEHNSGIMRGAGEQRAGKGCLAR